MNERVACVIPAYAAARTLPAVLDGVRRSVPAARVVVVDDGSPDATAAVARAGGALVLSHAVNRGKGAALRTGIARALADGADIVATMDADGQHDPAMLPRLLDTLRGAEMVIGSRDRAGMPIARRATNLLASAAVCLATGAPMLDTQSGFRAVRRAVLIAITAAGDGYEYETELLIAILRARFRVVAVPVPTLYGARSHFRPWRDSARVVRALWRAQRTRLAVR